jgi:hypothetical protein
LAVPPVAPLTLVGSGFAKVLPENYHFSTVLTFALASLLPFVSNYENRLIF